MDNFKQVGKQLRGNKKETETNSRRIAENFPLIERKVDHLVYNYPYEMDFNLSDHPHSVKLNLFVRPPENCFQCQIGPSAVGIDCSVGGGTAIGDGNAHPIIYTGFNYNHGGFDLDPAGGVIVPQDGVYNIQLQGFVVGLTLSFTDALIVSTRKNGVIVTQQVYSVPNGKLGIPYSFVDFDFTNTWGLCIPAREGDTIGGWLAAAFGFFDPNGLGAIVTLVGLG